MGRREGQPGSWVGALPRGHGPNPVAWDFARWLAAGAYLFLVGGLGVAVCWTIWARSTGARTRRTELAAKLAKRRYSDGRQQGWTGSLTLFGGERSNPPVNSPSWLKTEVPVRELPMPELQSLDGYSGETVEELIALEGKYCTYSLVSAFDQALLQKAERVGDDKLTEEERIILAIKAMECEVYNGGYGQFFVNCSLEPEHKYVPIIVDALRRIGCPKTAEITQKAMRIVQETPMTDEEIENGTWEENEERQRALDECDNLYYEQPENIAESLFAFIKANRDTIEP